MKSLILFAAVASVVVYIETISTTAQTVQPDAADVIYARADSIALTLDVYLPKHVSKPYPVVVWVHGGAWLSGSKDRPGGLYLVPRGFALVSINYRLSQQALYPAQIHDCKGAIRWIRAHADQYGFDPAHIGVWGGSAGGHLVSLLGTTGGSADLEGTVGGNTGVSSRVQAVCDWYGPSNFLTIGDAASNIAHDAADSPESRLIGGAVKEHPDLSRAASPVFFCTPDDAPFLIMHGTADMTVPFRQSAEMDSALRAAGVPVTFIPIPGAGHGGALFSTDTVRERVIAFFTRHLKPATHIDVEAQPPRGIALSVTPQPAATTAVVSLVMQRAARVSIVVYALNGSRVADIHEGWVTAGAHAYAVPMAALASGSYIVELTNGRTKVARTFIVRK